MAEYLKGLFFSDEWYFYLVAVGFISFGVTFVLISLVMLIYGMKSNFYIRKHYSDVWSMATGSSSRQRVESGRMIKTLGDKKLEKIISTWDTFGKRCLLLWFVGFSILSLVVILFHVFFSKS